MQVVKLIRFLRKKSRSIFLSFTSFLDMKAVISSTLVIFNFILIIIIIILLDNTITGRTSSSHCGPLKLQIQIAKIRSKNTVKN